MGVKNYLKKSWYLIGPIVIFLLINSGIKEAKDVEEISKIIETEVLEGQTAVVVELEEEGEPVRTVSEEYVVTRVVDGDTFKVMINGEEETVRVIGINTPETVDPRKDVECFGREASEFAKKTLVGQKVALVIDPTQDERDRYQRLLRYVTLVDGRDYGEVIISFGYAYEYTYIKPYEKQAVYKEIQAKAKNSGVGLWSSKSCSGLKSN